jgi:hypothetical protein
LQRWSLDHSLVIYSTPASDRFSSRAGRSGEYIDGGDVFFYIERRHCYPEEYWVLWRHGYRRTRQEEKHDSAGREGRAWTAWAEQIALSWRGVDAGTRAECAVVVVEGEARKRLVVTGNFQTFCVENAGRFYEM